jgi:hypothetical protein
MISRRELLRQSMFLMACAAGADVFADASAATKESYISRATFDAVDQSINNGNGNAAMTNEAGALGWGEAYILTGYVLMYEATRDTYYLDKIVKQFDQVLQSRDSVRGIKDWRGLSLPAWQSSAHYTCNQIDLKDASGKPTLQIRSARNKPANGNKVTVAKGSRPNTFKIIVARKEGAKEPVVDEYDNLTMDPASAMYAVKRINELFAEVNATKSFRTMTTAKDLRSSPGDAGDPALGGPWPLKSGAYIYAVQNGMLVQPISQFVRIVYDDAKLHAKYKAKADEYLTAVDQVVNLFDHEWQENTKRGEGWYVFGKGSPSEHEGAELPHNQYLALARPMLVLSTLSPDPKLRAKYLDRATKMARTFKNDLTLDKGGAYTWPYFWSKGWGYRGWTAKDNVSTYHPTSVWPRVGGYTAPEDISHGVIDICFAVEAYRAGLGIFDVQDMKRFAKTFIENVLTKDEQGEPTCEENVDGSGSKGGKDVVAAGWTPLAEFDRRVFDSLREIYELRKPKQGSSLPQGLGYLMWFTKTQTT